MQPQINSSVPPVEPRQFNDQEKINKLKSKIKLLKIMLPEFLAFSKNLEKFNEQFTEKLDVLSNRVKKVELTLLVLAIRIDQLNKIDTKPPPEGMFI